MTAAIPIPLTVVVLTYNEEANIEACLQSVADCAKEIFVVDSGSTDRTVEIAERCSANVVDHPFENYATQRNWAQRTLPIETEWVFHIDADERVSTDLAQRIGTIFAEGTVGNDITGFLVRRRVQFLGRSMRFGGLYPTYHCRIFRKQLGECEARLYDQHFVVRGHVARIEADLIEVTASSLAAWTARHNRWAQMEARQSSREGRNSGGASVAARLCGSPIERRRWFRRKVYDRAPIFSRALAYFCWRYVLRGGFLDGRAGLIYHVLQGFWFRFYVDACIYELRQQSWARSRRRVA